MAIYGSSYGGWFLPNNVSLDTSSVVISVGVGEDISFDLAVQSKFGSQIYLFDPTERAQTHYNEVVEFYKQKPTQAKFSGDIQPDYLPTISKLTPVPDMSKIHMEPLGLWLKEDTVKFYKQTNPKYVSQTIVPNMFGQEYTLAKMDRLSSILDKKGLSKTNIALMKMDIEGAELDVLDTLLEDKIYPKILCVEFDYLLKGQDTTNRTNMTIQRLKDVGYTILYNKQWNIVFEHTPSVIAP